MKHLGRIISLPIGLVLIAVGIIIFVVVNRSITHEFTNAAIVLPDNKAPDIVDPYARFIGNEGDENNVRNYKFSVFNLTNPAETMAGELPKYEEVGPYEYNYIYQRIDPTLSENDEKLSFKLWKRYNVILKEGNRNPSADTIYHFNLAYAGALETVGGEKALSVLFTASAMGTIINSLASAPFKSQVTVTATPTALGKSYAGLVAGIGSTTAAFSAWRNGIPPNFFPLDGFSSKNYTLSSAVNEATFVQLFDSTKLFSLSNTNQLSINAYASPDKTGIIAALVSNFTLSAEDATLIVSYQNYMRINYVPIALVTGASAECALSQAVAEVCVANFGLIHWSTQLGLLNGASVFDLLKGAFAGKPEFGLIEGITLSMAKAGSLFKPIPGTPNLVSPAGLVTILTNAAILAGGGTPDTTPFTAAEYLKIAHYVGNITTTFIDNDVIKNQIFGDYIGGPIVRHTVQDFLFNSTDPLLKRIKPQDPTYNALNNYQTIKEANDTLHTDSIHTGKGDIDLVSAPITYDGDSTLNYTVPVEVSGAFGEQLPPNYLFKNSEAQVYAFTEEFARSLLFKKEIGKTFLGANVRRYRIDESNWMVNPDYAQTINYLMNLTAVKGAPVYISRPRMKGLDAGYFYKAGVTELMNNEEDLDVFADYEPRSGKAINGRYSLQVNSYIKGNDGELSPLYNKYSKMQADVIHPLFWGASIVAATQDQVDILIQAYQVDSVRYALTVILIVVGGFLSFCSVGLFGLDILERKGYF